MKKSGNQLIRLMRLPHRFGIDRDDEPQRRPVNRDVAHMQWTGPMPEPAVPRQIRERSRNGRNTYGSRTT